MVKGIGASTPVQASHTPPKKEIDPLDEAIQSHAASTLARIKGPVPQPSSKRPPSRFDRKPAIDPLPKTDPPKKTNLKQPGKKKVKSKKKPPVKDEKAHRGLLYEFFSYIFRSIGYMILKMLGRN